MIESFTGNLLVASSLVDDPMYASGVCLIVHQDETNVIGVMLNRPLRPNADALKSLIGSDSPEDSPQSAGSDRMLGSSSNPPSEESISKAFESAPWRLLHFGGPLSGPVVAIHQHSQYAEAETGCGVYVAAQKEHLEDLVRHQEGPCRLIVGHLGWEAGQLDAEIDAGLWHLVPATADTVFSAATDMWPRLIRRATSNSMARWMGVEDVVGASAFN